MKTISFHGLQQVSWEYHVLRQHIIVGVDVLVDGTAVDGDDSAADDSHDTGCR